MITTDELKQTLPVHLKSAATQELADKINQAHADPDVAKVIRDNFVSYTNVLKEGRFKTEDYLSAVTYVSFKLFGFSNQEAYARTFPQRYQSLRARGASDKDISSFVAAYNKNKLVNLIVEQSLVPTWILNQDAYQKAINVQVELMNDTSVSNKVRSDAANSILTHLKRPEKTMVELDIGIKETSGMSELNGLLLDLAQRQQALIAQGMQTQEIAHQKLVPSADVIEATAKDVTPKGGTK